MADRVYTPAKPNPQPPQPAATNGGGALPSFPVPKSQAYQRPTYRPTPPKKSKGRSCRCRCGLCCCLLWFVMVVLLLAFICAVAGGVFYLLYHPIRPTFSVSSVHVTQLNLTSSATSAALTSSIDMFVTAKNPNKKVVFVYDDFAVSASTVSAGVPLGDGSLPAFTADVGNTTVTKVTVSAVAESVDPTSAPSELKKTSGSFLVAVDLDTKAGVQIGSLTTKKIGIQVHCDGIKVSPPPAKPKNATLAAAPTAEDTGAGGSGSCDVSIRIKIWKWTF